MTATLLVRHTVERVGAPRMAFLEHSGQLSY
jgi:hypothetical protein